MTMDGRLRMSGHVKPSKHRAHIAALMRRAEWLRRKLDEGDHGDPSRRELAALNYAIDRLRVLTPTTNRS